MLHCVWYSLGSKPDQKLRSPHQATSDGNWSSFQLANSTPPQSVIDNAIAPPARIWILVHKDLDQHVIRNYNLARRTLISVGNRANASCRRQKLCCGPTPEGPPKALQTSECDELLDLARTSCLILVQRQPGKFMHYYWLKFILIEDT